MVNRKKTHAKSVNYPLWLQLNLSYDWSTVSPELVEHFIGVIETPSCVALGVKIVFRSIIDSSFAARDKIAFSCLL